MKHVIRFLGIVALTAAMTAPALAGRVGRVVAGAPSFDRIGARAAAAAAAERPDGPVRVEIVDAAKLKAFGLDVKVGDAVEVTTLETDKRWSVKHVQSSKEIILQTDASGELALQPAAEAKPQRPERPARK